MAIQFPSNPVDGQILQYGSTDYIWSASLNRWRSNAYTNLVSCGGPTCSTGFLSLPNGTTCQRPQGYNVGFYLGCGGTRTSTNSGIFTGTSVVHTFTTSGQFTMLVTATVAYLVVGGGGGGGLDANCVVGPGGAGGLVASGITNFAAGTYNITVGAGIPATPNYNLYITNPDYYYQYTFRVGTAGSSSITYGTTVISTATGGSGGGRNNRFGGSNACYLGGAVPPGASGGGAGAAGAAPCGKNGGPGVASTITGSLVYYGGGGGGGGSTPGPCGRVGQFTPGVNGTGGGGGGGTNNCCKTGTYPGGRGANGAVILSYQLGTLLLWGSTRFNSTLNRMEMFNGYSWNTLADGISGYNIDILLVGAGGAGFNSSSGGGAGGYLTKNITVTSGTSYNIVVGVRGSAQGGAGGATTFTNSSTGVTAYTALGGQGGQSNSGGNSGNSYSPKISLSWGYPGSPAGGGAGSREPGHCGIGGVGTAWYDGVVYAAGGSLSGGAGSNNTGNGGGGGAAGGSGIVKLRYPGTNWIGTGGSVTVVGSYVYHSFTSSGTYIA